MSDDLLKGYLYRGARVLVLLHERELRSCLGVWRRAKEAGVVLPQTDDPNYASLSTLLLHILRCPRSYRMWMTEKLGLPDPGIEQAPPVERIEQDADRFLAHVLERWRLPLARVQEKRFDEVYTSKWGIDTSIESMLEHAVVHPMRHTAQLEELMGA